MRYSKEKDREYLDTLKACVDVRSLLTYYGALFHPAAQGDTIRCNCIVHGGTNSSSLGYKASSHVFRCFGECGFKGDVFKLVQAVEHCSFADAVKRVEEFSACNRATATVAPRKPVDPLLCALEATYAPPQANEVVSSNFVERAKQNKRNPYVVEGRYKASTMNYFEVGYCDFNEMWNDRAIIPIHDEDGHLVGWSGRDMDKERKSGTKYRIKKGFRKGCVLYNLHRAYNHVNKNRPLVICEGFGQVWRLHEGGIRSAVALMGKDATDEQLSLILKHSTRVVLALDFDKAGVEGTFKLGTTLSEYIDVSVATSNYAPDIDLGDMFPSQAVMCVRQNIPFKDWVKNVYSTSQFLD